MGNKYIDYVVNQLENYRKTTQQMKLLCYEIEHIKRTTATEVIEVMTFQKRDAASDSADVYPKKVPEIALSYQQTAAQLNNEAMEEIISVYADLRQERDRLLHYISLLDDRQQTIIQKYYFDLLSWNEIAGGMNLTVRTVQRVRQQAVGELANLYAYANDVLGL